MAFLLHRLLRSLLPPAWDPHRPPALEKVPECIVLEPETTPSSQPTVRIYLGTERGQFRAERVFLWSVMQHRDPARRYEIHLLRELAGFQRGAWLTGFTNYRFLVPELTGFSGRAIYNDTDQIYLTDPAELFDQDMGSAGFLSINDRDTSVMLIDCERMAKVWGSGPVRRDSRKALEAAARAGQLWGQLDGGWNARDSEYDPTHSKVVHFTTLQTQPWRPFPDQFVYLDNPTGDLWPALEDACTAAGFLPFTASRPSRLWPACAATLERQPEGRKLLAALAREPDNTGAEFTVEGLLDQVPDNDLPWVLERLFAAAGHLHLRLQEPRVARPGRARRSGWFWQQQLQLTSRRHPDTRWDFYRRCGHQRQWLAGGPAGSGPIVVLTHGKPGHNNNALALARSLAAGSGRRLVELPVPYSPDGFILERLAGRGVMADLPNDTAVIVASGWLPTRVARRAAAGMGRDLRLVLLGRKAGPPPEHGGVVVQCGHFGLPPHPNRIRTLLPMNAGMTSVTRDPSPWQSWLDAPQRVALLVGGDTHAHQLSAPQELARQVSEWARDQGARLLVVTGRRTLPAIPGLRRGLTDDDLLYMWRPNDDGNPYSLALAHADALVVTGESESMLADAASAGLPLNIWPLSAKAGHPWQRFVAAVATMATRHRYNARGSIRPQQGLRYLCARLLERGVILPPRNLEALHDALYQQQLAAPFAAAAPRPQGHVSELDEVVRSLIARLRLDAEAVTAGTTLDARQSGDQLDRRRSAPLTDLSLEGGST
ncbi:MAG: mitochondrial fission ELM1 family protein [Gammaproteobacteria bacterium]|nr:mitochondrial fission ELM1 family protein [Gammaproteobacteria bacterium]